MTDKSVWRQAVVSQRYTGPERRAPDPDAPLTLRRFALLLVIAALMWLALGFAVVAIWSAL